MSQKTRHINGTNTYFHITGTYSSPDVEEATLHINILCKYYLGYVNNLSIIKVKS